MLSTKGVVSLICIGRPPLFMGGGQVAQHPSWRFMRLRPVGQLGFLDSGNVDIVAVEESQQFCDFSADSARFPLHQT